MQDIMEKIDLKYVPGMSLIRGSCIELCVLPLGIKKASGLEVGKLVTCIVPEDFIIVS